MNTPNEWDRTGRARDPLKPFLVAVAGATAAALAVVVWALRQSKPKG